MHYWVMKSEPSSYSIADLERDRETQWDGVRNYQVRNFMRDHMKMGDKAYLYHSSCDAVGIVGEMEVVGEAVPDTLQFIKKSDYYDAKSTKLNPRWLAVTVAHRATYDKLITRSELMELPALKDSPLIKAENRLSIIPLTKGEFQAIQKLIK
jgi:predicted RNA-binding protein with PUA-like domain